MMIYSRDADNWQHACARGAPHGKLSSTAGQKTREHGPQCIPCFMHSCSGHVCCVHRAVQQLLVTAGDAITSMLCSHCLLGDSAKDAGENSSACNLHLT